MTAAAKEQLKKHKYVGFVARYSSAGQDELSNVIQLKKLHVFREEYMPQAKVYGEWQSQQSAFVEENPELNAIYDDLKRRNGRAGLKSKVTLLVLLNWTRFFRNALAAMHYIYIFRQIGVEINTIQNWIDHDDPNSVLPLLIALYQAEQYSRDLQRQIRNGNAERLEQGVYCHNISRQIYRRVYYAHRRYHHEPNEPAFSQTRASYLAIMDGGMGLIASWNFYGGREVLGAYQTWRDRPKGELSEGKYRGKPVNVPALLTPEERARFNSIVHLNEQTKSTPDERLERCHGLGAVRCPTCGKMMTYSNPTNGSGVSKPYMVCAAENPRHYRVDNVAVNGALRRNLVHITATHDKRHQLANRLVKRTRAEREKAKLEMRSLERTVAKLKGAVDNATLSHAMGDYTDQQLQLVQDAYGKKLNELDAARLDLDYHEEILAQALVELNDIGTLLRDHATGAEINAFWRMLCPDGLVFDPETSTFRTGQLNSAYEKIISEPMSYNQIKLGDAAFGDTPPVGWRIPESNR